MSIQQTWGSPCGRTPEPVLLLFIIGKHDILISICLTLPVKSLALLSQIPSGTRLGTQPNECRRSPNPVGCSLLQRGGSTSQGTFRLLFLGHQSSARRGPGNSLLAGRVSAEGGKSLHPTRNIDSSMLYVPSASLTPAQSRKAIYCTCCKKISLAGATWSTNSERELSVQK